MNLLSLAQLTSIYPLLLIRHTGIPLKGGRSLQMMRRLAAIAVIGALLAAAHASPGFAQGVEATTSTIVIEDSKSVLRTVLRLDLDKPISVAEAKQISASLQQPLAVQAAAPPTGDKLWCWGSIVDQDANGSFDIQYSCHSPRTLAWGWKLKPAVKNIVVGSVSERGLEWWRNGGFAGQNAPHVVPPDYHFHGTMKPVYRNDDVDYQGYITFRHNVGSGGTGSVSMAGSVVLQN